jgi:glycosyltransferase involved in cell wall biosynthesis
MFRSNKQDSGFRENLNLKGKFISTYAGAHGLSNDLDIVLEAARELQSSPKFHFILAGDGKEKTTLIQKAKALQLQNVTFLDPIPKNQIFHLYAASDACIAILKPIEFYKTTYPNKVFDYMAASRAVICAIDGEIRKVVEAAHCGLFVQPGNSHALALAIQQLQRKPALCKEMGQAGRKYLEKYFDRKTISKDFLNLVNKLGKNN